MDVPAHLAHLTGTPIARLHPLGHSHAWTLHRAETTDGRELFVKALHDGTPSTALTAEAAGLRWLAAAHSSLVPPVLAADPTMLVLAWQPTQSPTPEAAEQLGHDLATLHAATPDTYGAPWNGYIATLPLDNTPPYRRLGTLVRRTPPGPIPFGSRPRPRPRRHPPARTRHSPHHRPRGPTRTTLPHPRRPVVRQHPLVPGPRPPHRPRRPRRPPRNRPRHARPLRRTPPRPHPRRLPGSRTAESGLAATSSTAPAPPAARTRRTVRRLLPRHAAGRRGCGAGELTTADSDRRHAPKRTAAPAR